MPPPPAGISAPGDEAPRPVELITPPPLLFAQPAPPVADPEPPIEVTAEGPFTAWRLDIEGGRTFKLLRHRVLLGRDPVARSGEQEIVVNDPTLTVSKTHALLELVDDVWQVTDLGSVNGVILLHPDGTEHALTPGIPEVVTRRFALGRVQIALSRSATDN